jgi:hypothetical protein
MLKNLLVKPIVRYVELVEDHPRTMIAVNITGTIACLAASIYLGNKMAENAEFIED